MPNIPKDEIESLVLNAVLEMLKNDKNVQLIIKRILETESDENPGILSLTRAIAKAEKTIENLTTAISMGGSMAILVKKLNEANEQKEKLEYDLRATRQSSCVLTQEQLEAFFETMKIIDITNKESKAFLIDVFVNSVYVYDDGSVVITTNFRGEDGVFLKRESVRLLLQPVHHFLFFMALWFEPAVKELSRNKKPRFAIRLQNAVIFMV